MSKTYSQLSMRIERLSNWKRILILYFLMIVMTYSLLAIIPGNKEYRAEQFIYFKNTWERFLYVIFLGPLIETMFFQYALIELFQTWIKKIYWSIILSAFAFSVSHLGFSRYMIVYFLAGLILGFCYSLKNSIWMKIGSTFIVHAMVNLTTFVIQQILMSKH